MNKQKMIFQTKRTQLDTNIIRLKTWESIHYHKIIKRCETMKENQV